MKLRPESFFVKTLRFKCVSAQYSSQTENVGTKIIKKTA